ncbi:MAG: rod shape-determining protein MreD [Actinobacteria bacterium]|nr:rod shape-determining protein MreD [Actinomycetota bacterium]
MTGVAPTLEPTGLGRPLGPTGGSLAGIVLVLATVALQVTVMPSFRVADAIPDLLAIVVALIGARGGALVGGVAGFSGGLLIEVTTPSGTLGVLALCYLTAGIVCGRFSRVGDPGGLVSPLLRSMTAVVVVQSSAAIIQFMLGRGIPASVFVGRVLVPSIALTVVVAPPVIWVARRALGRGHAAATLGIG